MSQSKIFKIPSGLKPQGEPSSEGWLRCAVGCKTCGPSEKNHHFVINVKSNPPFSMCHKCGGHWNSHETANIIDSFSGHPISFESEVLSDEDKEKVLKATKLFRKVKRRNKNIKTLEYLESRGVASDSVIDLPLYDYEESFCIHNFVDENGETMALHAYQSETKKYLGKKSFGLGILREGKVVLISEGLVNLLSVNSILHKKGNTSLGLVTSGDAGNLKKLTGKHSWLVRNAKKVIILADYDRLEAGQDAAMSVARQFPSKVEVLLPPSLGQDWNDLLIAGSIEKYL